MADFRPLVLDGTQIEELDGANDRLMVGDIVSVIDSGDRLRFPAADTFNVQLSANTRFQVNHNGGFFSSTGDTELQVIAGGVNNNAKIEFGLSSNQDQCVFDYETSSVGDNAKKLTLKMEGLTNSNPRQVVGIQTHLIGIGTVYNTAVVIPSRGNIGGNLGTRNDQYYETQGICNYSTVATTVDAPATQFGSGLCIIRGGDNSNGPTIEFIKNRGNVTAGLTQEEFNGLTDPVSDDVLGELIAGGSVQNTGTNPPISATLAFKANNDWSTSKQGAYVDVEVREYTTNSVIRPLTIGRESGTSDAVGGKTIQLPIAPSGSGTAYLRIDSNNNIIIHNSSKRYKKNIKDVTLKQCQNIVDNLRPVRYEFKGETIQQYGLIAEEVEQVDRVLATHNNDGEVESVNYESIAVMLLKVVKDQQKQITKLETRIAALEG